MRSRSIKKREFDVRIRLTLATYVTVTAEADSAREARRIARTLRGPFVERLHEVLDDGPDRIGVGYVHPVR